MMSSLFYCGSRLLNRKMDSINPCCYFCYRRVTYLPYNKFQRQSHGNKQPCILVAMGAFSPPTLLHLRMMEECKHQLSDELDIIGGVLSPVHDEYATLYKESLKAANGKHRFKMCQLATETSNWIGVSDYEISQNGFINTIDVLNYYQTEINSSFNDNQITLKLMCGTDLLLTFMEPNCWSIEDQIDILSKYGVVMMQRKGYEITKDIIKQYYLFEQHKHNIKSFSSSIENDISSTIVRKLIKNNQNIKYLTFDSVIDYIKEQRLYITDSIK
eukprot:26171_1